jgi:hypothetical protein
MQVSFGTMYAFQESTKSKMQSTAISSLIQRMIPSLHTLPITHSPRITIALTMSWDTSATLQLLAILGSIASVSMAWYQRRYIAAASHWLRGEPSP